MSLSKWYSNRKAKGAKSEDDEIEKIFELLEEGDEQIVLDENHKNPIFTLGNTGSGKSTLVKFIATDNKSMYAEETYPGSYEFIIKDEEESIGGGITSQTLFPVLVVDEDIQAAHYDCPGFNDTRSPSTEIATSYFIKKVFDFADELKIVLTVNHSSVRPGIDRKDLMDLLRHTTTLVKDIDKYGGCIALFATKVENVYGGGSLVPDEVLIKNIAFFLDSVKKEIQEKLPKWVRGNVEEEQFHKNAIKLIDVFLTQDAAGKYTRIGLFRRADKAGPLLEIELLQERKPDMKQVIYEAIKFTKKDSDDFGHTISDTAKLQVNKMVDRLRKNVSTEIDSVVKVLEKNNQDVTEQIQKIIKSMATGSNAATDEILARELATKLSAIFDATTKLRSDVVQAKAIKDIAEAIEVCGTALKIETETAVSNVMRQDNYFDFFQNIMEGLTVGDYSKNFDGIMVTLDATRKAIDKDTETMANIVKERVKVNANKVPNALITCYDDKFESLGIEDLVTEFGKQHKIVVEFAEKIKTINSLQELSKEITNMVSKSAINSTEVNAATLEVFNYGNYLTVLNIFKKEVVVWSPDWIKPFEGHADYVFKADKWYSFLQKLYVKFATYEYFQYRERYDVANIDDWGKDGKPQGIKITKESYTTFLEKINETDETIKKMDLDDKKSKELNRVLELTIKQKTSTEMKSDGELMIQAVFVKFSDFVDSNGKLKPELSNGKTIKVVNIFAMDTIFIDADLNVVGEKLQVNVVAPKWETIGTRVTNLEAAPLANVNFEKTAAPAGSNGKDGNPGLPGGLGGNFVGVGYEFKAAESFIVISKGGKGGNGTAGGAGGNGKNGANAQRSNDFRRELMDTDFTSSTIGGFTTTEEWKYIGQDGGVGGKGGDGGASGLGGLPGNFKVIRTDGISTLPTFKGIKGATGNGADGASGGQGGKRGNDLLQWFSYPGFASIMGKWSSKSETITTSDRAANGEKGKRDFNTVGRKEPESADPTHIGQVLNAFEFYMREVLDDRFLKQTLKKFLDNLLLHNNLYIDHIYDTKTLADNLSNLEIQLHQLNNKFSTDELIYLYQSIIERTTEYSKNPRPSEDTKEYKKALKYICAAALSQIQHRKYSFAPNLVIDVTRYLDNVLKNVNILKDLSEKANKLKVVNGAKEKLKTELDKKIAEALGFIEHEILPEIESVYEELAVQIDKLVDEVRELQESAIEEKKELEKKKRQLQNALALNIMIGVLRAALVFAGPVGSAAGILVQVIEKNAFSRASVKASDIESIKMEIRKLKEELEKAKANKPDPQLLADIQKRYEGNSEKLSTIDDAIEAAEEKFKALYEYEKFIYNTMVPMFDDMEKHLDEISAQLGSQSQVALDVTKWMVQSTLRDVKSQMKQMTRGFSVEDDIARCIEKLEEAMTAQINLYDRIQSYQDQQTLVDYIAVVSTGVDESNPELTETLTTLEIMIRSNLVLDQHKQAVNAVTQNVFPFAHFYLNDSYRAFSVRSEEGLAEVVAEAVKQLELMKANIEKYKTSIGKQDEYITNSQFNSDYLITKPFFVWENEGNKGLISKLLSGEKIILSADVRRANTDIFAIKFNLSEINFKAPKKEIQAEINEKLKKFKANMKHLGSSYYRFKDGVYVIYSESQTVQYSFQKDENNEPVQFNGVYEKIKNGDLMLSPFAMWEMQLTNAVTEGDFMDLEKFKDKVDLELVGRGNYVNQDLEVGVLYVDNYYKPEPSMLANDKW